MVKPISNFVFFTIDKEKETEQQTKFGILHLANQEHGKFNRIYGKVIAVPGKLKDDIRLHEIHQGMPAPQYSFTGEDIEELLSSTPYYLKEKKGKEYQQRFYSSSPAETQHILLSDIVMEVEIGDKAYFHYNTIEEENRYTLEDGTKIYKVRYDQIICSVRDGKIIPIGSHVLVTCNWDEDFQDLDMTDVKLPGFTGLGVKKGKISKSGLVTELHGKPKPLEGTVAHIGTPFLCEEELGVNPGDKIVFLPESDWTNKIEDCEFYVMKQRDIIGVIE